MMQLPCLINPSLEVRSYKYKIYKIKIIDVVLTIYENIKIREY